MDNNECSTAKKEIYIKVTKDGPYLVYGVPKIDTQTILVDENEVAIDYGEGKVFEIKSDIISLCRCGESKNAPFCDGTHTSVCFDGKETASFEPILKNAVGYEGPNLILMDNESYCALARFCEAHGSIWNLVYEDNEISDEEVKRQAALCPSGRLMVFDKKGNPAEPVFEKSISIIEDGGLKISGPIWLRGGIRVESEDGNSYEIRNRQTICRCGKSKNKPFCDAAHVYIKFKATYPN